MAVWGLMAVAWAEIVPNLRCLQPRALFSRIPGADGVLVGTGYRGLTAVGAPEGRDPAGGHTAMKGLCANRETRAGGCPGTPGYGYPQPLSATASTGCGAISGIFSLTGGPLDEAGKAP